MTKVWVTTRALSQGILEVDGEDYEDGMFQYKKTPSHYTEYAHGEGKEWHRSLESAQKRAEVMRLNKVESLRKQIGKMETLKIKVVKP